MKYNDKLSTGKKLLILIVFVLIVIVISMFIFPSKLLNSGNDYILADFYNTTWVSEDQRHQLYICDKYFQVMDQEDKTISKAYVDYDFHDGCFVITKDDSVIKYIFLKENVLFMERFNVVLYKVSV